VEPLLPEWRAVRNKPQRNAYHRFTVDRHLLEAAANAAPLALSSPRPDLLLLGTLLHDIGKGFPGDHTDVGQQLVDRIGRRMGLDAEDVGRLVTMVRLHLLLPDVATRRDIDDPATVTAVAEAVGDPTTLALLAGLTEADSLATGPSAWGPWKAGLVAELVSRTRARLAGEAPPSGPVHPVTDRHRHLMAQARRLGRSVLVAEVPEVTVVAEDRPGLLATVTGVLALFGIDVRAADVAGEDGFAVERFVVGPSRGRWPDWARVADDLQAALRGSLPLAQRLAERAATYERARRPVAARPVQTRVTVDNEASAAATVVDVRTTDGVGILHRLTQAVFDEGLDVVSARVSTLGAEVVDAFYVCDPATGGKLRDAARCRSLEQALAAAAGPVTGTADSPGTADGPGTADSRSASGPGTGAPEPEAPG
jgi:[protein-PII] uridylyltransferase